MIEIRKKIRWYKPYYLKSFPCTCFRLSAERIHWAKGTRLAKLNQGDTKTYSWRPCNVIIASAADDWSW